ncbi:MAG: 4Fe-4S binding protein [Oscillospiraceae bacterium]|nr:4Fe-4S binding protein [Oscillospiraceae bacterium]
MKNITFNEERCKGCGLCAAVCPQKIIANNKEKINQKGYYPAGVKNKDLCTSCGQCAIICPDVVIKIENDK